MSNNLAVTPGNDSLPVGDTLYRLLFENGMDGLMLTAPDGSILDANPAACRIFQRSREEILEQGRDRLMDSADPRMAAILAERNRTGRGHSELTAKRRDGTPFPVEVSSVVFTTPQGETRTCTIIRDISERKTAETEREQLIKELQEALGRVKSLSGLLPICASCKKIRDQQGKWQYLEIYIRTHTEADFSHGICPECRAQLYPEFPGR